MCKSQGREMCTVLKIFQPGLQKYGYWYSISNLMETNSEYKNICMNHLWDSGKLIL
jgi:hypothetical protein